MEKKKIITTTDKTWKEIFDEMKIGDEITLSMYSGIFHLKKTGEIGKLKDVI